LRVRRRSERLVLPDHYVVLDPDELPVTRRHWWLGVLAGNAPTRVGPAPGTTAVVAGVLGGLPAGRWWPANLESWLRGLPRVVPDRAGLPAASPEPQAQNGVGAGCDLSILVATPSFA
jgi:hypothetical protein